MDFSYSRKDILQGLSNTLQNMLHNAQKGAWEEVANHNRVRMKLASQLQLANNPPSTEEAQIVSKLKQTDAEVLELAKKARDEAADNMQDINGKKSHVNQYLQNQFV